MDECKALPGAIRRADMGAVTGTAIGDGGGRLSLVAPVPGASVHPYAFPPSSGPQTLVLGGAAFLTGLGSSCREPVPGH